MPCFGVLNQSATIVVDNKVILGNLQYVPALSDVLEEAMGVRMTVSQVADKCVILTGGRATISIYQNRIVVEPRSIAGEVEALIKKFIPSLLKNKAVAALQKAGVTFVESPVRNKAGQLELMVEV